MPREHGKVGRGYRAGSRGGTQTEEVMKRLSAYNFHDVKWVPDGYSMSEKIDATSANMEILVACLNDLAAEVSEIQQRLGIEVADSAVYEVRS